MWSSHGSYHTVPSFASGTPSRNFHNEQAADFQSPLEFEDRQPISSPPRRQHSPRKNTEQGHCHAKIASRLSSRSFDQVSPRHQDKLVFLASSVLDCQQCESCAL